MYVPPALPQYLEAGTLIIPDNVMTIFTDSGSGYVNFDPALAAKYAMGLYYHTAF